MCLSLLQPPFINVCRVSSKIKLKGILQIKSENKIIMKTNMAKGNKLFICSCPLLFLIGHSLSIDTKAERSSRKVWLLTRLWLFFFPFYSLLKKRGKKKRRMKSKNRDLKSSLSARSGRKSNVDSGSMYLYYIEKPSNPTNLSKTALVYSNNLDLIDSYPI